MSSHAESSAAAAARVGYEPDSQDKGHQQPAPTQVSEFPNYADGDVYIMSPTGRSWKLHSTTLSNATSYFADILTHSPKRHIPKRQRLEGKTIKWSLKMVPYVEEPGDLRFRSFEVVTVNDRSLPMLEDMGGDGDEPRFNKTYDNLFRCLYSLEANVTNDQAEGAKYFIFDVVTLLQAAEHLGAVSAVRLICEAYFLRLNQTLWTYIGSNPESWADIGARLQSPIIFREALCHIAGAWDLKNAVRKDVLRTHAHGEAIVRLATAKARELKEKKVAIERRLAEYFPAEMIHVDTPTTVSGRAVYATDIYLWMALTLIRQYLTSCFLRNKHHRAEDGGIALYRKIAKGGEEYVDRETRATFHVSFGMSTRGRQRFEEALSLIKGGWKVIVGELMVDNRIAHRGPNSKDLPYLTCTVILDEELPWYVPVEDGEDGLAL